MPRAIFGRFASLVIPRLGIEYYPAYKSKGVSNLYSLTYITARGLRVPALNIQDYFTSL